MNTTVEDEIGTIANFIIFGKLTQQLISLPVVNLTIDGRSDRFIISSIIEEIVNDTYIFQITFSLQNFNIDAVRFKVTNFSGREIASA